MDFTECLHFFYVGVYITLGKKAAYDVSNF